MIHIRIDKYTSPAYAYVCGRLNKGTSIHSAVHVYTLVLVQTYVSRAWTLHPSTVPWMRMHRDARLSQILNPQPQTL